MMQGGKSFPEELDGFQKIQDAHVHCYPKEVISDPVGWARKHNERHWERLVTEGPQGWADPDDLLRAMDDCGVEQVLLQAWYWENAETARLQNDWHSQWVARHPERFSACAAVHPDLPEISETLSSAEEWGAVGVGECLPQVQSSDGWRHPGWKEILDWTTAHHWPFCLHVTEPAGHSYSGRVETPLMETLAILEQHPDQKWLCAHWGGGLPFYSMNKRVKKALRNVWFDSAASTLLYDKRVWKAVCDLTGPDKILFGSDFPLRLHPGEPALAGWQGLIDEFRGSGLSAEELDLIGYGNMRRLFRID